MFVLSANQVILLCRLAQMDAARQDILGIALSAFLVLPF